MRIVYGTWELSDPRFGGTGKLLGEYLNTSNNP